jgi:tryptophan 7-halogenase
MVRSVVIVGGGVAAWIAAAALARALPRQRVTVRVIEPPDLCAHEALLEAGESCLPSLRALHRILGIDERDFMRNTDATFKLGTELRDWARPGAVHFHGFGETGAALEGVAFHQHWLRLNEAGQLSDYSLAAATASLSRFAHPASDPKSVGATLDYAYHLDSASYRLYLQEHARRLGVECIVADVLDVRRRAEDGFIESVLLEDDRQVAGELFIDASGPRGLLIERSMQMPFESWSQWLPCDRAVVTSAASSSAADLPPCTTAAALRAGWRWRIPLRRRVSHGYIYCSRFISDDEAGATLLANVNGEPCAARQSEPRVLPFIIGRRRKLWTHNCVALGAAACFLEPLAATQIHLIHSGIAKLLALFPRRERMVPESEEYNRLMGSELERVRDFLILHYCAPRRTDSPFWAHCAALKVPESLERKIHLFTHRGRVVLYDDELFSESSWACLFTALGIRPRGHDALAATTDAELIKSKLRRMRAIIQRTAHAMPDHRAYLERYCPAPGEH